jgi:hypothetical protein
MSNAVANKATKPTKPGQPAPSLVPPEEQFWKRYSPHGEAPLSLAGSFAVHALGFGGILLFAVYLASILFAPLRNMPVEAVRLDLTGGGGGSRRGVGDGPGVGGVPHENIEAKTKPAISGVDDPPPRPELNPADIKRIEEKFDTDSARYIAQAKTENAQRYAKMNETLRDKLADGLRPAGAGQGGTGSDGGKDSGKDKGKGSKEGPGKSTLTKREKRMLRWHIRFTANTGPEYVAQLRSMGAILGFPVNGRNNPTMKVVRDLRAGTTFTDEDVSKLGRIYWEDDKPRSVGDVLEALRLKLSPVPGSFFAFMPEELEQELFRQERDFIINKLRLPFDEDRIQDTNFRAVLTPQGKYRPQLTDVIMKE